MKKITHPSMISNDKESNYAKFKMNMLVKDNINYILLLVHGMSALPLEDEYSKSSFETDVVIVGAGASGIAAAQVLHQANINFLLLEADQKIGGRIQSEKFGDYLIENGANWIHGTYCAHNSSIFNPIWELKHEYDMIGNFTDFEDQNPITENGKYVDLKILSDISTEFDNIKSDCLQEGKRLWKMLKESKEQTSQEDLDISVNECLERNMMRRRHKNDTYARLENDLFRQSISQSVKYLNLDADYAIPSANISLMLWSKENTADFEYVFENFLVTDQRGYNIFLKEISAPFKEAIKLGHKVYQVNQNSDGVILKAKAITYRNPSIKATTLNLSVKAKLVICTVPLGVLQKDVIQFQPDLPTAKKASIMAMKMANLAKVFIKFPHNFWGKSDLLLIVRNSTNFASISVNLDHSKYFPGSNMIATFFHGDDAIKVESQDIHETKSELMKIFRRAYSDNIPDPINIHVTNWTHNPLSYGSYSATQLGFTSEMWDLLRENVGRIYFAGEHTSENFSGFVHGAYDEGQRIANAVIKRIQTNGSNSATDFSSNSIAYNCIIAVSLSFLYHIFCALP